MLIDQQQGVVDKQLPEGETISYSVINGSGHKILGEQDRFWTQQDETHNLQLGTEIQLSEFINYSVFHLFKCRVVVRETVNKEGHRGYVDKLSSLNKELTDLG